MFHRTLNLNNPRIPNNNCLQCAKQFLDHCNGINGYPAGVGMVFNKATPSSLGLVPMFLYEENMKDFLSVIKQNPDRMLVAGKSKQGGGTLFGSNHVFNIIYDTQKNCFTVHDTTVGRQFSFQDDDISFEFFQKYIGPGYFLSLYKSPQSPRDDSWFNE